MSGQQYLTDRQIADLEKIGRWVYDTCTLFGATGATAWKVAGLFVGGIETEWSNAARGLPPSPAYRAPVTSEQRAAFKRRQEAGKKAAATRARRRQERKEATPTSPTA